MAEKINLDDGSVLALENILSAPLREADTAAEVAERSAAAERHAIA